MLHKSFFYYLVCLYCKILTICIQKLKCYSNLIDSNNIKSNAGLSKITFDISDQDASTASSSLMDSPIAYSYMYIQWEANDIISDELIRNLSLTFATIAIVSLILIIDLRVSDNLYLHHYFNLLLCPSLCLKVLHNIQWEANHIISDEFIRNLSLTFAKVAISVTHSNDRPKGK